MKCNNRTVQQSQQTDAPGSILPRMPWGLKRYQQTRQLHFITFTCDHRQPWLADPQMRDKFVKTLETVRLWYGFWITGYVVMPEHVHLLVSEPERKNLGLALQMLKQMVSRKRVGWPVESQSEGRKGWPVLSRSEGRVPFWQARYYDFNVWSEAKRVEKLRYTHRNPVTRGLVERPEDWEWSSFRHYLNGEEGKVEIESHWTAKKREQLGVYPTVQLRDQNPPFASR